MSSINPLFLDSTKPIGDKVVTNVELFNVSLRSGDSLYFEVTDEFGFVQRFAMKCIETKKSVRHTAEVWLKYQHQIQYRFLVVAEGEEVFTSVFRETLAGHIISEKWEPCFDAKPVSPKKRKPRRVEGEVKAAPEIKTQAAKPLGKPQFLDQLKSLIDDLL
ncbi:hypothetical protein [Bdellovibrio sp. HCB2-146]|uniref:hypothetical protein n=1 Tax=Bdellovibrio sp. HCB2-146 TaxID=3394362 RepID=UPI0039BD62C3